MRDRRRDTNEETQTVSEIKRDKERIRERGVGREAEAKEAETERQTD